LVNRDTFSWLGCNEDFVRSLGFLASPWELGHCAKEAAGALGRHDLGKFLWDLTVESYLFELGKAQVAKRVVPTHELSLIVGSS
jgi:hypothetical protein